ncbi:MAG: Hsp70 family protein [Myxococcales bacterium]|nr:Hsp70 family protein [Myxococcales bacterium]
MSQTSLPTLGIDLGTTNCALAVADGERPPAAMPIPQVVGPGELADLATLPSFLLLATSDEVDPKGLALPWAGEARSCVGAFAAARGAELPHRLVSSAKSWLCSPTIDRNAAVLPWRGASRDVADDGERVSPVNASARYLAHLRAAWDDAHPDTPADELDVVLTVPASFDAAARELTVAAARQAGLDRITLLEEPLAAFYAYLASHPAWRQEIGPGDVVLVCDVGGGTTDFSLIEVTEEGGELGLTRIAVGDHILLGGDNMDLALAAGVARDLAAQGKTLDAWQHRALTQACRRAKETLLSPQGPESLPITIASRGSRLLGGTVRAELQRAQVLAQLVDGFFPVVELTARPTRRPGAGLRELGLPYAHDPAITRHLAELLSRHGRTPTAVLFNGGVMKAEALRARVREVLRAWTGAELTELRGSDLDLAVALGAASYGQLRHRARAGGTGLRIRSATARAYYIGIESSMPAIPGFPPPVRALCVAPQGLEEGSTVELPDDELGLVVGEPVSFRFFSSTTRKDDAAGVLLEEDEPDLVELDPVEQTVPAHEGRQAGDLVPVRLSAHVTEVGTLELWCTARDRGERGERYRLEYSVRERP